MSKKFLVDPNKIFEEDEKNWEDENKKDYIPRPVSIEIKAKSVQKKRENTPTEEEEIPSQIALDIKVSNQSNSRLYIPSGVYQQQPSPKDFFNLKNSKKKLYLSNENLKKSSGKKYLQVYKKGEDEIKNLKYRDKKSKRKKKLKKITNYRSHRQKSNDVSSKALLSSIGFSLKKGNNIKPHFSSQYATKIPKKEKKRKRVRRRDQKKSVGARRMRSIRSNSPFLSSLKFKGLRHKNSIPIQNSERIRRKREKIRKKNLQGETMQKKIKKNSRTQISLNSKKFDKDSTYHKFRKDILKQNLNIKEDYNYSVKSRSASKLSPAIQSKLNLRIKRHMSKSPLNNLRGKKESVERENSLSKNIYFNICKKQRKKIKNLKNEVRTLKEELNSKSQEVEVNKLLFFFV